MLRFYFSYTVIIMVYILIFCFVPLALYSLVFFFLDLLLGYIQLTVL